MREFRRSFSRPVADANRTCVPFPDSVPLPVSGRNGTAVRVPLRPPGPRRCAGAVVRYLRAGRRCTAGRRTPCAP